MNESDQGTSSGPPVPASAEVAIVAAYGKDTPGLSGITPPLDEWILAMSIGFFELADSDPPQFLDSCAEQAHAPARSLQGTLLQLAGQVGLRSGQNGGPNLA